MGGNQERVSDKEGLEMTPYEDHAALGHKTVRHSPDGFVVIEECPECGARFLLTPLDKYPRSLYNTTGPVLSDSKIKQTVNKLLGESIDGDGGGYIEFTMMVDLDTPDGESECEAWVEASVTRNHGEISVRITELYNMETGEPILKQHLGIGQLAHIREKAAEEARSYAY